MSSTVVQITLKFCPPKNVCSIKIIIVKVSGYYSWIDDEEDLLLQMLIEMNGIEKQLMNSLKF
jgi:hypothetical protein